MKRTIALAVVVVLSSCKSGPPPAPPGDASIAGEKLTVTQGLTDFTASYRGDVEVPEPMRAVSATYEVVRDGKVLKTQTKALDVAVAPGTPFVLELEDSAAYAPSAEEVQALIEKGENLLVAIRGKLTLKGEGRTLEPEFAASKEIRAPRSLSVKLHELDAARYSAEEVNALVQLGIVNPNSFPVRIAGLSYGLAVGGKPISEGVLGKGEKIDAASTGVFDLQVAVNRDTFGPEVTKLIKSQTLPYALTGELSGELFKVPYELKGEIKLNVSK
jgi:LEA14-like dessication related protein